MIISDKRIIQGNWSLNIIQCVLTKLTCWDVTDGSAPFWRLYANFSPQQWLYFEDKKVEMNQNNIIIVPPNTAYQGELKGDKAYHFFIHFSLSHPIYPVKPQFFVLDRTEEIKALLNPVNRCLNNKEETSSMDLSLFILALISLCLSRLQGVPIARPPLDDRVQEVMDMMDNHMARKLDVDDLARSVNLSTGGLCRLFKQETNHSPLDYLNEKRINRACELLHDSRLSIDKVAELCGYSNRYYFTRVFKKYRRNSPAAFRKMLS